MSQMEIDRVLAQIRSISQATAAPAAIGGRARRRRRRGRRRQRLREAAQAGHRQRQCHAVTRPPTSRRKFERGVPGVELPQVMLEMQKANVSFRALTEVRNKFVDAYREIMNMPL